MKHTATLLVSPVLLLFLFFFIFPFAMLASLSFFTAVEGARGWQAAINPTFTTKNYADFLLSPVYMGYLFLTLRTAIVSTLIAILLGYPIGYSIARSTSKASKKLLLLVIIVALYISNVGRVFSLVIIIGRYGTLNWAIGLFGLGPLELIGTEYAIDLGILHYLIPIAVLSLVGAIQKIDPSLEEAAQNLGATGAQTFLKVTLPLSLPGIIAATVLCAAIGVNFFLAPIIMGAGIVLTLPVLIYNKFMYSMNYPFGAVMSVILLIISLVMVFFINRVLLSKMRIT